MKVTLSSRLLCKFFQSKFKSNNLIVRKYDWKQNLYTFLRLLSFIVSNTNQTDLIPYVHRTCILAIFSQLSSSHLPFVIFLDRPNRELTDIHPFCIEQIKSRRPGLDINAVQRTKIPRRPLKRSFASFALNSLATRVCAPIMRPNDNVATRVTCHDRSTLLFTLPLPSAKSRSGISILCVT